MQRCKDTETQTAKPFFRDVLFFCSFMLYLFLLKAADPQPFNKALSLFAIVIHSLWLKKLKEASGLNGRAGCVAVWPRRLFHSLPVKVLSKRLSDSFSRLQRFVGAAGRSPVAQKLSPNVKAAAFRKRLRFSGSSPTIATVAKPFTVCCTQL